MKDIQLHAPADGHCSRLVESKLRDDRGVAKELPVDEAQEPLEPRQFSSLGFSPGVC